MGLRRGSSLQTLRASLDKLRHKATEFAQQERFEKPDLQQAQG